jgi:hypothetical protein
VLYQTYTSPSQITEITLRVGKQLVGADPSPPVARFCSRPPCSPREGAKRDPSIRYARGREIWVALTKHSEKFM